MKDGFEELLKESNEQKKSAQNAPNLSIQQPSQIDLTGYLLHILVKICDILYLSVCQIPVPIRSFTKILADAIQKKNPKMTNIEIYKILNEFIIEKWLSISF